MNYENHHEKTIKELPLMAGAVLRMTPDLPPVSRREVCRYAGAKDGDESIRPLVEACIREAEPLVRGQVCYRLYPVAVEGDICRIGSWSVRSAALGKCLGDCREAVLFGATIGVEFDRLIGRYGRLSPAKALIFQGLGAERIEAVCDAFCDRLAVETGRRLCPRFSPGYGDLSLDAQRDLFRALDGCRSIGLTLNDSLLMSPSKSVTAIVGLRPPLPDPAELSDEQREMTKDRRMEP